MWRWFLFGVWVLVVVMFLCGFCLGVFFRIGYFRDFRKGIGGLFFLVGFLCFWVIMFWGEGVLAVVEVGIWVKYKGIWNRMVFFLWFLGFVFILMVE